MRRSRIAVLLLSVLVLLVSVLPIGTGSAAYMPDQVAASATRMRMLGLVKGTPLADGTISLNLDQEITRAELVVILVRAFGQEDGAKMMAGAAVFPDMANHWASGYVAMAKAMVEKTGDAIGMPDGTFNPSGKVTAAQSVAFLMKFLGIKADSGKTWPANYLETAVDRGLLEADDAALLTGIANTNATRGLVFYVIDHGFSSYRLSDGKTVYQTYVDGQAPGITVDQLQDFNRRFVTLTGKVSGDAESVKVQGRPATLKADGTWHAVARLTPGKQIVEVVALDYVGNEGQPEFPVLISWTTGVDPSALAFMRDDTIWGVSLDRPAETFMLSPAGSAVRVGEWAQYSQPAVSADGNWVYYVRAQSAGGRFTNAIMRSPFLPEAQPEVMVEYPGDQAITDLAVAPGGGVMFEQHGTVYRLLGKSATELVSANLVKRFAPGTGDWMLADTVGSMAFMGMTVPVVKAVAVCGPMGSTKVLSKGADRVVHWDPAALPDGSGLVYGDTLEGRIAVQTWDGVPKLLDFPGLAQEREDADPTVARDGSIAFQSTYFEAITVVVVKDYLTNPTVVAKFPGSAPSLGGGPVVKAQDGPCGSSEGLGWNPFRAGPAIQGDVK